MNRICLTCGTPCLVDPQDFDLNRFGWWRHEATRKETGYARRENRSGGRRAVEYMHRVIGERAFGSLDGLEIDHINGDGLDNRRSNLRPATRQQNARNLPRGKRNSSGYKGVAWFKRDSCWRAYIRWNAKYKHLGYFASPEEAHEAYKRAATELYGEFARFA